MRRELAEMRQGLIGVIVALDDARDFFARRFSNLPR
jgi:hypothetical protein